MSIDPNLITAISSFIGCLSLIVLVWQIKANHDKGRREKALEIMRQWDVMRQKNSFRYEGLMFSLSPKDVELIQRGQSIEISKELATEFLPELVSTEDERYVIDVMTVLNIRNDLLNLLNTIENIALAYKHNVCDRQMLDEAFYHFLIEKEFLRKCREFMVHFGAGAWPAVNELPKLMNPPHSRKAAA